ncbi:MAG: acyl-CoA dehydrogenase family protein [Solirubrobacterales bacterium]
MSGGFGVVQEQDWDALGDEEFRQLVRAWVEANYPEELRFPPGRLLWSQQGEWVRALARKGWIAPGWPLEFGGMGLSPVKQVIFAQEFERFGVARFQDHGITQVGPIIMSFGSPEQRAQWLPPILAAEHIWAQGYSEPEAGSDLASLRTRARRDGDEYVVDGQKIWTTLAHDATHIYVLVRTDPKAPKPQAGISFLLADLASPGITVRPIRDIAGHSELCEVFFDGVRVPVANRIGEENKGWTIAKSLLGHERINVGSPKQPGYALEMVVAVARERGLLEEPVFRDRLAALQLDVAHLGDAYARYTAMLARGEQIGPDVSMLKIWATETVAAIADLIIEAGGDAGGLAGKVALGSTEIDVLGAYYKARPAMVYAGSNEIQRNIIATAVLGLPRG